MKKKSMKRKLCILFFCIVSLLSFAACNYNEAKKEADEKLKQYKPAFEQAVKNAYGDDAKLTNVKCSVDAHTNDAFQTTFYARDLQGTLKLDGRSYRVFYDELHDSITDNVHTEDINKEILNGLPFDNSVIIESSIGEMYLDPSIDTLDKLLASQDVYICVYITTTEDLSGITVDDPDNDPFFKKFKDSPYNSRITVKAACLRDKSSSGQVIYKMNELYFTGDDHPEVYYNNEYRDAFEVYGIKNAVEIKYSGENDTGRYISFME